MKSTMLVASLVLLSTFSAYAYPSFPLAVYPAPVPAPVVPALKSQFHAQDELGQYTYGYTDGLSAKTETKTFDGVTRGGYSYLDSNGIVQNVNYVSDPANGFRVAASNLPLAPVPAPAPLPIAPEPVKDTPEVIAAKEAHFAAAAAASAEALNAPPSTDSPAEESETPETPETPEAPEAPEAPAAPEAPEAPKSEEPAAPAPAAIVPAPAPIYAAPIIPAPAPVPVAAAPVVYSAPAPAPLVYSAPVPVHAPVPAHAPIYAAPVPHPAPIVAAPILSQYHSQDELGQYSYGYAGGPSAKSEIKTFDGITRGGYSYLDANGIVQSASYVSDPVNGFRVAATNIPQPAVPVAIPDSPEVAEAKAKHFEAAAQAAAAAAASPATD